MPHPALFTKPVSSLVFVGGVVGSIAVRAFGVDSCSERTTAPSPKSFLVLLGAVTDEALLAGERDPVEAGSLVRHSALAALFASLQDVRSASTTVARPTPRFA